MDQHEVTEMESELNRHHRDFARISKVIDVAFEQGTPEAMETALKVIRNIVG